MALAMTGGSLMTASLLAAPTSATSITLSLSSDASSCTITNPQPGDICLTTPVGGGMVVGKHTLTVSGDMPLGYTLTLQDNDEINTVCRPNGGNGNHCFNSVAGSFNSPKSLADDQWGFAIPGLPGTNFSSVEQYNTANTNATYAAVPPYSQPLPIVNIDTSTTNYSTDIYYGFKASSKQQSGLHNNKIVYTATAKLPPAPTVEKLILNDTILTNQEKELAIEGTGMDNVADIIICPEKETSSSTNCLTVPATNYKANNNTTIASFTSPKITNPGTYHVYASTGNVSDTYAELIVQEQTVCRSGDNNSNCMVDIDPNMIPIIYTGNETTPRWTTTTTTSSNWYDYGRGKDQGGPMWANAVTVKANKLNTYKGTSGVAVDNNDILGYWVYIPRYAYEVQRRDATDKFVIDEYQLPDNVTDSNGNNSHVIKNDFIIKFETNDTTKYPTKTPIACKSNQEIKTAAQMWKDGKIPTTNDNQADLVLAKDYRAGCNLNRTYTNNPSQTNSTTWATHPAFTFGDKELNGIWVGKFETTGSIKVPTVKPNQYHKADEWLGVFYDIAKSVGVKDNNNPYGNGTATTQNSHNLNIAKTHMLKNSEWGAVSYLSSSAYGAGVNNVQINGSNDDGTDSNDGDGKNSASITGCGPKDRGSALTYECFGRVDHQYQGTIGQLASTTGNAYGIYDMAGGAYEYVMGNLTASTVNPTVSTSNSYFKTPTQEPYVDLYRTAVVGGVFGSPAVWSSDTSTEYFYNNDQCDWPSCGGQALHETKIVQSVLADTQSYGGDGARFVKSGTPWLYRGGKWDFGPVNGLFYSSYDNGSFYHYSGFRTTLLVIKRQLSAHTQD